MRDLGTPSRGVRATGLAAAEELARQVQSGPLHGPAQKNHGLPLWRDRLGESGGAGARAFTASIGFDRRLWREDLAVNRAHLAMLAEQGLVTAEERAELDRGLDLIEAELSLGTFPFRTEFEDIHLNIERRLIELLGPVGGKIHTARSRNDQVATDLHLHVIGLVDRTIAAIRRLQRTILEQAKRHGLSVMPGYTHLQHAQPILLGHHWLAYFWMLERDAGRLVDCRRRARLSPLGAAALAGTGLPIDRHQTAQALDLGRPYPNSLDAVSDRDFALEFLAALAICQSHLSRLGEEIVIWASTEFGFVELPDELATGSSIMPQKKNPDVAELVRGKTGRVYGHLLGLLTVLKGLPLAYHSDLQEDKEAVWGAADTVLACLEAMDALVGGLRARPERMNQVLAGSPVWATDLADWLARRGVPFREAHAAVGGLVRAWLADGRPALTLAHLQATHPAFTAEALEAVDPERMVRARRSYGGTAPEAFKAQLAEAEAALAAIGREISANDGLPSARVSG